jgi:hypothetical protein
MAFIQSKYFINNVNIKINHLNLIKIQFSLFNVNNFLKFYFIAAFILFTLNVNSQVQEDVGAKFDLNKKNKPLSRKGQMNFTPYFGFPNIEKRQVIRTFKHLNTAEINDFDEINVKALGLFGLRTAFFLKYPFSLGLEIIYSKIVVNYIDNYEVFDYYTQSNIQKTTDLELTLNRLRIMAKFKYHFNITKKTDTYLSIGCGWNNAMYNLKKDNEPFDYDINDFIYQLDANFFLFPVVFRNAIGINYSLFRNFNLNLEIGIGGPIISTGITFDFNKK